jgi:hypothetical protein
MGVGHGGETEAEPLQNRLERAAQFLRMLQRAWAVKRDSLLCLAWQLRWQSSLQLIGRLVSQYLDELSRQFADPLRF